MGGVSAARPDPGPDADAGGHFRLGSESPLTYRLKWAAWEWLYTAARCRAIGFEVRLQGPWGSIVDVAGIGPDNAIYAVEVKSSRADFARDNHTSADLARLRRRFDALARRIALASAPGYCDAAATASDSDRERLLQERQRLRERLNTISTKFHHPNFLAIADYHYLMAPPGVVPAERLPPQWGLLAPTPTPSEIVPAPAKPIRKNPGIIANALRAIARANTTAMMRAHGVRWGADGAEFPQPD